MNRDLQYYIGGTDQNYPQGKEMQKAKWLSETLQIAEKRSDR